MKMVINERLKHRLVGLAVIVSLAAIFTPAILKKSSHHLDEKISISVKLPPKPRLPNVQKPSEKDLFKHTTVAHVDIPSIKDELEPVTSLAKAQPLKEPKDINTESKVVSVSKPLSAVAIEKRDTVVATKEKVKKTEVVKSTKVMQAESKTKSKPTRSAPTKVAVAPKGAYAVQLATFAQQANAVALVNKLNSKGYKSVLAKVKLKQGFVYKVLVGQTDKKQDAQLLQQKLASVMQIQGLVVSTHGIS